MRIKKAIQWTGIGISALCMILMLALTEMNINFSRWHILVWLLFHNGIWAIDLIWKDVPGRDFIASVKKV